MDRINRKTLSSILARIAALENENKTLKAKANKEAMVSRGKNMISDKSFVGKNTQTETKHRIIAKKTYKKQQESSLEQSSSEQELDDTEIYFEHNSHFMTFLTYICHILQG